MVEEPDQDRRPEVDLQRQVVHLRCPRCGTEIELGNVTLQVERRGDRDQLKVTLGRPGESGWDFHGIVEEVQRHLALEALRRAGGVKKRAADIAGMKYSTFHALLDRLGLGDDDAVREIGESDRDG